METPERRRQLNVWLTIESLNASQTFAEQHGTNVTALAESLGRYLQGFTETDADDLPEFLAAIVRRSQEIAGTRSSRSRRSES